MFILPEMRNLPTHFMSLGWSVIPLLGSANPARSKTPALPSWKVYQGRKPTSQELNHWLTVCGYEMFGIVLGRVSSLIVIDIDRVESAKSFQTIFPDLLDTLIISSGNRNLPHYYFRIENGVSVPSRIGHGCELRADGQYVVAPCSQVGEKTWDVVHNVMPRLLTENDLRRLAAFVGGIHQAPLKDRASDVLTANSTLHEAFISVSQMVNLYRTLAGDMGRNNALFRVGCYGRDRGLTEDAISKVLVQVHSDYPSVDGLVHESWKQRAHEAMRTLKSVFRRPPCPVMEGSSTQQLPNAVRERLLQLGADNVARLLDSLYLIGYKAGDSLKRSEIVERLQPLGIGRNQIYAALKISVENGENIFREVVPPPPPPSHATAAYRYADETNQCLFGRVSNPVKNRGRPSTVFFMPSIKELCTLLKVKNQGGDHLQLEDIKSPAAYRAALHKALIRRAPGKYPRRWLANRLGVSSQSCRRYEQSSSIEVFPTYLDYQVTWKTVENILIDEDLPGRFLQDENGKKYPGLLSLAKRLLAQGRRLILRLQDANHYRVVQPVEVIEEPAVSLLSKPDYNQNIPEYENKPRVPNTSFKEHTDYSCEVTPALQESQKFDAAQNQKGAVENPKPNQKHRKLKQAPKASAVKISDAAEHLYVTLRTLNPQNAITRNLATSLIMKYGESLVRRGLRALSKKKNIQNPGGFLIVWLRGEMKFGASV